MRGSPLLSLFVLAIALLALGIPVWSLTRRGEENSSSFKITNQNSVPEKKWVDVTITSSAPGSISVTSLARTLFKSLPNAKSLEGRIEILAKNPDDLVVSAKWENSPDQNALRVEIKSEGQPLVDTTFWGTGFVEDALTIPSP